MFDFGLGSFELLMIAIVAIIVVGPKDLPKLLRAVGQFMTKVRSMAREFQGYIDEAARDTGLDDVKKEVNKMTNFTVTDPVTKPGVPDTSGTSAAAPAKTAPKADPAPAAVETKADSKPKPKQPPKKAASKKPAKTKQDA